MTDVGALYWVEYYFHFYNLLKNLDGKALKIVAYADEIVILITGKFQACLGQQTAMEAKGGRKYRKAQQHLICM